MAKPNDPAEDSEPAGFMLACEIIHRLYLSNCEAIGLSEYGSDLGMKRIVHYTILALHHSRKCDVR